MENNPTICQGFVSHVLKRFSKIPGLDVIHYMDDVLLAYRDRTVLDSLLPQVLVALEDAHLKVSQKNIQLAPPYEFLG